MKKTLLIVLIVASPFYGWHAYKKYIEAPSKRAYAVGQCEKYGGYQEREPVPVSGYLVDTYLGRMDYSLEDIVGNLIEKKFDYLEISDRAVTYPVYLTINKSERKDDDKSKKYYKFFIKEDDFERCEVLFKERGGGLIHDEWLGNYGQCISFEEVKKEELESKYEFVTKFEERKGLVSLPWVHHIAKERDTSVVVSEILYFSHCVTKLKQLRDTAVCQYGDENYISCPSEKKEMVKKIEKFKENVFVNLD